MMLLAGCIIGPTIWLTTSYVKENIILKYRNDIMLREQRLKNMETSLNVLSQQSNRLTADMSQAFKEYTKTANDSISDILNKELNNIKTNLKQHDKEENQ